MKNVFLLGLTSLVALVGCKGSKSSDDKTATSAAPSVSTQDAGITITLNGESQKLEPNPVYCSITYGGQDFIIQGGLPDGDNNPGNNKIVLQIGGQNQAGAEMMSIRYSPDDGSKMTHSYSIKGADAPFMKGNRFQWSGTASSGAQLEVDAVCPVVGK